MFSIAICRPTGDKRQSKTLFLTIFDILSSIVLTFSIAAYPLCLFCRSTFCVIPSFAIILLGKRELQVVLLLLSSVIFLYLFLMVPWVSLQRVIVAFPVYTGFFILFRDIYEIHSIIGMFMES